jgi:trehalose 6-phosphate phosphatase
VPTIEKIVDSIAYKYGLRKTRGKCVFELRPAVKWDKGRAAKWLLEMIQCREKREYVPVYVGDDVTDEDALRFVTNFGGVGIIVTEDDSRETAATWRLRDPDEVAEFLEHFVRARPGGVSPSSS